MKNRRKESSRSELKTKEEKVVNSNEVPKHRHKRIFMLAPVLSESEGVPLGKPLDAPSHSKKTFKSNFFFPMAAEKQKMWE